MKTRLCSLMLSALVILSATGCEEMDDLFDFSDFEVESCSPSLHQTGVVPDAAIEVTFNEKADQSSVERNFSVTGDSGTVEGEFIWTSQSSFRFVPRYQFKRTERYVIEVSGDARSDGGKTLIVDFISDFYVGNPLGRPGVIASDPVYVIGGTLINDPGTLAAITVQFSGQMDVVKTETAFSISPSLSGYFTWANGDRDMTYSLVDKMEYGKQYSVSVNASAEDTDGNPLTREFTMLLIAGDDVTPPQVTGMNSDGTAVYWSTAVNNPINRDIENIYVFFDEDMDKESAASAFSIDPSVDGSIGWLNNRTMVFHIAEGEKLQSEQVSQITVSTDAKDLHGLRLTLPYRIICETTLPDSKHIMVGKVWGGQLDTLSDTDTPLFDKKPTTWPVTVDIVPNMVPGTDGGYFFFRIQFLRDGVPVTMDETSLMENYLIDEIDGKTSGLTPVITRMEWQTSEGVASSAVLLKIDKLEVATPPTLFRFTLSGGDKGIKDGKDNTMKENFFFDFRE